jgi:LruC domain-containing protein
MKSRHSVCCNSERNVHLLSINQTMKNHYLFATALLLLSIISCKKQDTVADPNPTAPSGFLWEVSANIDVSISINDPRFGDASHTISVYNSDPQNGGSLIAKGAASNSSPFAAKIYLADTVTSLVIVKTAPDLSVMQQEMSIDANHRITATMGVLPVPSGRPMGGPDCSTGCNTTITSNNGNINVAENEVVCITGSNITVSFTANSKGTVRICGTNVTVQNANLNNQSKLIITSTGSAAFSNLNINTGIIFENYGIATIANGLAPNGPVTNEGTMTIGGDFSVNNDGTIINNGSLAVAGNTTINSNKKNFNRGTITTKNFTVNGNGEFTNLCSIAVSGDYNHNGNMDNYKLITVTGTTTINSNANMDLYNSAMFTTRDLMLNGEIAGQGTTSLFKVSGRTTINGNARIKSAIQYCDANGIETNYAGSSAFSNGAVQACNVYIPAGDCNKTGNGAPVVTDADGDGVADALDEYPADVKKAFNNYYPSTSGKAVVAFEDLWPAEGDYDFNDLVIDYRHNIVTNAANKVSAIVSNFTLLAAGGSYKNAFGIEFPLAATAVSGVTGGSLEAGQARAVIMLFPNMLLQMQYGNTVDAQPESAPVSFTTSFDVTNGPLLSSFGLGAYNPFIYNNGNVAVSGRNEIHLPGNAPTTLGSTALFGTKDDDSKPNAGKYYLTKTGMPWALTLPTTFKYPKEGARMTKAYTNFASWANSGGVNNPNWYSVLPGNMNNSFIHKP